MLFEILEDVELALGEFSGHFIKVFFDDLFDGEPNTGRGADALVDAVLLLPRPALGVRLEGEVFLDGGVARAPDLRTPLVSALEDGRHFDACSGGEGGGKSVHFWCSWG